MASVSPPPPQLAYPSSQRPPLSSSLHLSIHASPHLSSFKAASLAQRGLSSAPLQRPLWLSPPYVLSLPVLSVQPPVPIRGLRGRESPWSCQQRGLNTGSSMDFTYLEDFLSGGFLEEECFMLKVAAANRGQHCTVVCLRLSSSYRGLMHKQTEQEWIL